VAPLPHAARAILDAQKLEDYCLDSDHPRGRHKARVFREALGIGQEGAAWLRAQLLDGARALEAIELTEDEFGTRWRVDVPLERQDRRVVIRTVWIVRTGEQVPRFITCWVL